MEIQEKAKDLLLGYTFMNINNEVEVRLTDKGRDVYYHKNDELNRLSGVHFKREWPKEKNGWFECQLWELMQIFGEHIGMGFELVFETTIRIKEQ